MPVDVYIWKFRGFTEAWGHASMSLRDGTYISWWPCGGDERKSVRGNAIKGPSKLCMTLADDIRNESDEMPERLTIPDGIVNEEEIKKWWQGFSKKENWRAWDQNCSTVVYMALRVGLALDVFSPAEKDYYQSIPVWTPNNVKEFVQHLIKRKSSAAKSTR